MKKAVPAPASSPRAFAPAGIIFIANRIVTLIRGRVYAFRDRRVRKRQFRRLWIIRINAACRARGLRYSQLMHGLQKASSS